MPLFVSNVSVIYKTSSIAKIVFISMIALAVSASKNKTFVFSTNNTPNKHTRISCQKLSSTCNQLGNEDSITHPKTQHFPTTKPWRKNDILSPKKNHNNNDISEPTSITKSISRNEQQLYQQIHCLIPLRKR